MSIITKFAAQKHAVYVIFTYRSCLFYPTNKNRYFSPFPARHRIIPGAEYG